MTSSFSISTVAYSGYKIDVALDSIQSLGVEQIELALILGAIYGLKEEDVNVEFAQYAKNQLDIRGMTCSSLACHCPLTGDNCNTLLKKRLNICHTLDCKFLILYAPRDCSLNEFVEFVGESLQLSKKLGIRILIENVGDQLPYVFNGSSDLGSFCGSIDSSVMGVNYDPGNFASHRPLDNIVQDAIACLDACEHIHIKDVVRTETHYEFCEVGDGICDYGELLTAMNQRTTPIMFSIEAPYGLERTLAGTAGFKPIEEKLSVSEIEEKLCRSIEFIGRYLPISQGSTVQ
ncbi:sugar phosphate isomerase/epimerase [Vibrio sp. DW001]|uniref:sugar phosphate isomerase/epimerase family protein n=1 Tax=Vibrio sp. DW001 TaxID=2912315 RepID=UPI0023B033DA|nr:TIM barrel protein [Vibrio sp. DW001]WED28765.1 sugar phosphate isomerase/epimerase [Vibrio sp. DW001]